MVPLGSRVRLTSYQCDQTEPEPVMGSGFFMPEIWLIVVVTP